MCFNGIWVSSELLRATTSTDSAQHLKTFQLNLNVQRSGDKQGPPIKTVSVFSIYNIDIFFNILCM